MKRTTTPRNWKASVLIVALMVLTSSTSNAQQYCPPDGFTLGVEPICRLVFADIDNTSPGTSTAPANEDFTAMIAHVEAGATYTVTASGFTDGTPPDHLAANFDWDGDFIFETHVELADIEGDDCDTETTASFTVPLDAVVGNSRVRFVKTFSYSAADNGCDWSSSYGQSEDYTVQVSPASGISEHATNLFRIFPNPSNGAIVLEAKSNMPNAVLLIHDVSGRLVHSEKITFTGSTQHRIDLSGSLTVGTYSAVVLSGEARSVVRFVIQ